MFVKAALFAASVVAAALPLAAEPLVMGNAPAAGTKADAVVISTPSSESSRNGFNAYVLAPVPDPLGDIFGGRGPDTNNDEFITIAVVTSTGDRVALEIARDRLSQFGVSPEEQQAALYQVKLRDQYRPPSEAVFDAAY